MSLSEKSGPNPPLCRMPCTANEIRSGGTGCLTQGGHTDLLDVDAVAPLPQEALGTETRVSESLAGGSRNPGTRKGRGRGEIKGALAWSNLSQAWAPGSPWRVLAPAPAPASAWLQGAGTWAEGRPHGGQGGCRQAGSASCRGGRLGPASLARALGRQPGPQPGGPSGSGGGSLDPGRRAPPLLRPPRWVLLVNLPLGLSHAHNACLPGQLGQTLAFKGPRGPGGARQQAASYQPCSQTAGASSLLAAGMGQAGSAQSQTAKVHSPRARTSEQERKQKWPGSVPTRPSCFSKTAPTRVAQDPVRPQPPLPWPTHTSSSGLSRLGPPATRFPVPRPTGPTSWPP